MRSGPCDQALYQAKAEGRYGVRPFIAPMTAQPVTVRFA